MDYPWMVEGMANIGLKEIPGPKHNLTILNWLTEVKAWWQDDETPWCGVFVAHCIKKSGLAIPKNYMRAKDWNDDWGIRLPTPVYGSIVVFDRKGGGHVGFVIGITSDDRVLVLGGNQSNSVNLSRFDKDRVVGYYWPKDYARPANNDITQVDSVGDISTDES